MLKKLREFFAEIRKNLKATETEVQKRLSESDTLAELERVIEGNQEMFSDKAGQGFQLLKDQFDSKIARSKYASIIHHQNFYHELIEKIDKAVLQMQEVCERIKDLGGRVVVLN